MSALYQMQFLGQSGAGAGAIYVGRGKVVGIDATGARYNGSYVDQAGRLKGTVTLTSASGMLVTGQSISPGTQVPITLDLPANFAGHPQQIMVAGRPVTVSFDKIGDIP